MALASTIINLLRQIESEVVSGILTIAEAVAAIAELGWPTPSAYQQSAQALATYIEGLITGGGHSVASISAVPPIPTVSQSCSTRQSQRGICCAAVTQFGLARAAQGFQYTSCTGKTVCIACGTKTSVSKKNAGATVFNVKRVSCGPSGCPALGQFQGQIINPV